jgi:hypothetical protein
MNLMTPLCLKLRLSDWYCGFVFGRSRVRILADKPVTLTEASHGFSVLPSHYW